MSKFEDLIDVVCCAFPTGEVFWLKAESCKEGYIDKVVESWLDKNPDYKEVTTAGFVQITMPKQDYLSIEATNKCASLFTK